MRVLVVGGGIIGLLTAMKCVQAGAKVAVVEQGDLPNTEATSYDRHRIVRALHPGDPRAARAAVAARQSWGSLEHLLASRLCHVTGALTVLPPGEASAGSALLKSAGAPAQTLEPEELARRYRHIKFPAGMGAVLETDALLVFADRVLATLVRWLRSQPSAQLYRRRRVVALDSDAGAVRLADGAVVQGDRVVVAAGAWSRRLLPDEASAHLTLNRQSVLYCRVPEQLRDAWAATPAMPALGTDDGAWLVPPAAGTPLKVSVASACRVVTEVADRETPRQWQDLLADRCSEVLAGFNRQWVLHSRDCYYLAETATGGPLAFDLAGTNVRVFAACGGTSFKFAPLIARSLAEYALGGPHRLQPAQTGRITSPCNEHGGLGIRIRC